MHCFFPIYLFNLFFVYYCYGYGLYCKWYTSAQCYSYRNCTTMYISLWLLYWWKDRNFRHIDRSYWVGGSKFSSFAYGTQSRFLKFHAIILYCICLYAKRRGTLWYSSTIMLMLYRTIIFKSSIIIYLLYTSLKLYLSIYRMNV